MTPERLAARMTPERLAARMTPERLDAIEAHCRASACAALTSPHALEVVAEVRAAWADVARAMEERGEARAELAAYVNRAEKALAKMTAERDEAIQFEAQVREASIAHARTIDQHVESAEAELADEIARTDALVAALPECDHCVQTATHAWQRGDVRYCDDHVPAGCPEYPRAGPLRAILAARRRKAEAP